MGHNRLFIRIKWGGIITGLLQLSKERWSGFLFFGWGLAKKTISGYSLFIYFPLRRAVDGILIFFTRILTIDRCYPFFHENFLSSLCFDLDFIDRSLA